MEKKQDVTFWALVVSFIFGVSLRWPLWLKLAVILLSGSVLAQIARRLFEACKKERRNG